MKDYFPYELFFFILMGIGLLIIVSLFVWG